MVAGRHIVQTWLCMNLKQRHRPGLFNWWPAGHIWPEPTFEWPTIYIIWYMTKYGTYLVVMCVFHTHMLIVPTYKSHYIIYLIRLHLEDIKLFFFFFYVLIHNILNQTLFFPQSWWWMYVAKEWAISLPFLCWEYQSRRICKYTCQDCVPCDVLGSDMWQKIFIFTSKVNQ